MEYAPRFLGALVPAFAVGAARGMSRLPRYRAILATAATAVSIVLLVGSLHGRSHDTSGLTAARGINALMSDPVLRARTEKAVVLTDAPTVYAWIWDRPAVAAPIPAEIPQVRALLASPVAFVTCATGSAGAFEADLARAYAAAGGTRHGAGCPSWIEWGGAAP